MFLPFHDTNPTRRSAVVTYAIVAINVVALLWLGRLTPIQQQVLVYRRGFVPKRISQLVEPQRIVIDITRQEQDVLGRDRTVVEGQLMLSSGRGEILTSLITCMFLHGGWMHLIGNMWFLLIFGDNVEDRLGHLPFALFYLAGGLIATGVHWLTAPTSIAPVIGASGAVAAVLGAYAITWPWARVKTLVFLVIILTVIELPALVVLGFWFAGQILGAAASAGATSGVAWVAHIGGFMAGLLLMPTFSAWFGGPPPRPWTGDVERA